MKMPGSSKERDFSEARTYPAFLRSGVTREQSCFAVVAPMLAWLIIRRIDDELIYRRGTGLRFWGTGLIFCAHFTPATFTLSMPRSSMTFTAIRLWGPGTKGRETLPRYVSMSSESISAFRFRASLAQPSSSSAIGKKTCRGYRLRPS